MEMDAIRITAIIKELLKQLQNMSESGEDYDKLFCMRFEYELEELKKELGSILVPDCDCVIYEGS